MKSSIAFGICILVCCSTTMAAIRYVDRYSGSSVPPYMSWVAAATNIQDAIDMAVDGDTVLVNDGVYDSGTTVTPGYSSYNRIVITKPISILSMNGPESTIIMGAPDPHTGGLGTNAVRGVYMSAGIISGFTITNGYTMNFGSATDQRGGGVANAYNGNGVVIGCVITGNSAVEGGGSYYGTLVSCTLSGNSAQAGGGSYSSTLTDSTLSGNSANSGGASHSSSLTNCTLSGNVAYYGGGSRYDTLIGCTVSSNRAFQGGGSQYGTLINCTLSSNSATNSGGGSYAGTLNNCVLAGNTAGDGGGSRLGTLIDCTLSNNVARYRGGGSYYSTLVGCIISSNAATGTGLEVGTGGGSHYGSLKNCILSGNYAAKYGGGHYLGQLNNCTISGNHAAWYGGGSYWGQLYNCIIFGNTAGTGSQNIKIPVTAYNSCSPDLTHGVDGNITNNPAFVAPANFHLGASSPCINAGSNGYVSHTTDLAGNPRIVDGTVDMGAYESGYEGFFITNGIVSGSDIVLEWTAFPMWEATVKYSTNLATMPFTDLSAPLPYPMNSYTDLVHGAISECFYKVEIHP